MSLTRLTFASATYLVPDSTWRNHSRKKITANIASAKLPRIADAHRELRGQRRSPVVDRLDHREVLGVGASRPERACRGLSPPVV